MKHKSTFRGVTLLAVMVVLAVAALCPIAIQSKTQQAPGALKNPGEEDSDKTLSPYFMVKSDDPSTEQLPLKETRADVNIAGVIADVKVTQVYMNTGKKPIEAIYVFPASTRAAVYEMTMWVGDRMLKAKIQEKDQARKDYDIAKSQGKSASLLEQMRPNVFQMNVANIMPGDTIKVEMHYTELLIPEDGVYEFVYPTVVGPRYSNQAEATASTNDKWVSNPYQHSGEAPLYTFGITTNLMAGMTVKDVQCNTHKVNISYESPSQAVINLDPTEKTGGNRDYILRYRLADNKVESGLLLFPGEKENFFLMMMQPPARPAEAMIPPREYVFIMDVSGSMYGYQIETSKKLLKNLVSKLRPTDMFNVMLFAGSASMMSEKSLAATPENITKAISVIDNQSGGGGTELIPALKKALSLTKTEGVSRSFVIATDGYVSVEKEAFGLIRESLDQANFFAFGIGSSVNRFLIEGMANAGMGEPFIVVNQDECDAKAEKLRKYIQTPVLTDIKVKYNGFETYDVQPMKVPDVMAERPVIIYGKYKGNPNGSISITGKNGSGNFTKTFSLSEYKADKRLVALRYLWARERIRMLDDMNGLAADPKIKEEVTSLGLKYNLLTNYTSFIAIDSNIRNKTGNVTSVKQPLPLPLGVSDYAVGSSNGYGGATGYPTSKMSINACEVRSVSADAMQIEIIEPEFTIVEEQPAYIGGEKAMKDFLVKNITYPQIAKESGIQGKVYVEFTVETDGNISNVKVLRGIGGGCDEEAIRVVKLMAYKFKPGKKSGKPVRTKFTLPVKFQLN
ncbi:MAG: TonB family protein [Bacteroidota bacterium]